MFDYSSFLAFYQEFMAELKVRGSLPVRIVAYENVGEVTPKVKIIAKRQVRTSFSEGDGPIGEGSFSKVFLRPAVGDKEWRVKRISHHPLSSVSSSELYEKLRDFYLMCAVYPSSRMPGLKRFALDASASLLSNPRSTLPFLGKTDLSKLQCNFMEEGQDPAEKKTHAKKWLRGLASSFSGTRRFHKSGIAHLDIKPDNIRSNKTGISFIIDFGNALYSESFISYSEIQLTNPSHGPLDGFFDPVQHHGFDVDYYSLANAFIQQQRQGKSFALDFYALARERMAALGDRPSDAQKKRVKQEIRQGYAEAMEAFFIKLKANLMLADISAADADLLIGFLITMSSQDRAVRQSLNVAAAEALFDRLAVFTQSDFMDAYVAGEKDFMECNLTAVNLETMDLTEFNLRGANLTDVVLPVDGEKLHGVEVQHATLGRDQLEKLYSAGISDFTGVKLAGANLSNLNLVEANLTGMDLTGATLVNVKVHGATLGRDQLEKLYTAGIRDFTGVKLRGANLSNLNLVEANLRGADLSGANLTGVALPALLQGVKIQGAILGADQFKKLYAAKIRDFTGVKLENADLYNFNIENANFRAADLRQVKLPIEVPYLKGVKVQGAALNGGQFKKLYAAGILDFIGVKLRGANLSNLDLVDANLTDADLSEANLRGTDLTNTDLTSVTLTGVDVRGATLNGKQLQQLYDAGVRNFTGVNLAGADLSGLKFPEKVILTEANLTGANLTRTQLNNADLTNANLTGANLTEADLTWVTLTRANLRNVVSADSAIFTNAIFYNNKEAVLPVITLAVVNMLLTNATVTNGIVNNVIINSFVKAYKEDRKNNCISFFRSNFHQKVAKVNGPKSALILMQHYLEKEGTRTKRVLDTIMAPV
ncbi:MAG: pentapeptide repeat-containing protein [Gammaproteobacteria bacterium]|nr:pentapeptide repeat-containing protein [Gammaproteobacteria bacterium]